MEAAQRPDFGPRLSQGDYERRIVALHASDPAMPTPAAHLESRRAELNLLIDYRLGTSFPEVRRRALWDAQRRLDRGLVLRVILGVFTHPLDPSAGIVKAQVRAFGRILNPDELALLLDLDLPTLSRFLRR